MNRIYPSWDDLQKLRTSLTDGEFELAKFLDDNLSHGWEIYVQPYLNGDRPDIVILHPMVGMIIFEIKDWNLKLYKWNDPTKIDKFSNS